MEVVSGDSWTTGAISRAKLQSDHHHQQTNIQLFLQAGCPSCRPTDSVKALKGKISHFMDLLTPSSPGAFTNSTFMGYWQQRADERHGNPPPW